MNAKTLLKLLTVGALIVLAAFLLRGHDIITAIALSIAFLLIVSKITAALVFHRNRQGGGNGGSSPPPAPVLITRPRAPGAPPVLTCYPHE